MEILDSSVYMCFLETGYVNSTFAYTHTLTDKKVMARGEHN